MAEITAAMVKQLRDRTGAGMMECKSALKEADGNMDEAEIILRKRGIASASKKAARSTKQGMVQAYVTNGGQLGVLVELNCESDFVARNEDFQELVQHVAEHIAEANPQAVRKDEALQQALNDEHVLYEQPFRRDPSLTVGQHISTKIAKIGENIAVSRFARYDAPQGSRVGGYVHHGSQLGVLVEASGGNGSAELDDVLKDVAMQIAASDPQFIGRQDVTGEALDKEKDIQRARARNEGKPEKMLDKIVEGRMNKFYEEICLLEQPFIRDNAVSVEQYLKSRAAQIGSVQITRFARFKVGDIQAAEAAEA